jgi:Ca2+-dependent lipid-binding protein
MSLDYVMPAELVPGNLTVKVEFAKELQDKDWFGKQDPYVVLNCGARKLGKTKVHRGSASTSWESISTFSADNEVLNPSRHTCCQVEARIRNGMKLSVSNY